jgi:hypothetical protein
LNLKEISPFKDFFEPIGELVVAFSMLETHLNNTIRALGISPEDKILGANIPSRIEFFEVSLNAKLKDPDALAWTKDIAEDLRRANSHRNHIVHGPWNDFDPITTRATKLRFKGKENRFASSYKYTALRINEITSKMFSIMMRMAFLMGHAQGPDMKLGPSPGNRIPPCPLPD